MKIVDSYSPKRKTIILAFVFLFISLESNFSFSQTAPTSNTNPESSEKTEEEQNIIDSLKFASDSVKIHNVLINAIKIANQNADKNSFLKDYEVDCDTDLSVSVNINLSNQFTDQFPHLIIHREAPNTMYIDVFVKENGKFKKVVSHEQWKMTYVNDTIQDINGDGIKDFVVNWYGANGCCLKGFSDVYLLRKDMRSFSDQFEFINPTFSPVEKIVRGICYGHPGETEMYKYRWNGEAVDTIEYVSYEKDNNEENTGNVIISNREPGEDNYKVLKILKEVPDEYKRIINYDWFVGYE